MPDPLQRGGLVHVIFLEDLHDQMGLAVRHPLGHTDAELGFVIPAERELDNQSFAQRAQLGLDDRRDTRDSDVDGHHARASVIVDRNGAETLDARHLHLHKPLVLRYLVPPLPRKKTDTAELS